MYKNVNGHYYSYYYLIFKVKRYLSIYEYDIILCKNPNACFLTLILTTELHVFRLHSRWLFRRYVKN